MNAKQKNLITKVLVVLFWVGLWQIIALIINNAIILVSPISVIATLAKLVVTRSFWRSVGGSLGGISAGFCLGMVVGTALAAAASKSKIIKELLSPLMSVIKAVPVVSFIILVLFLINNKNALPMVVCFIMVLPVFYANVLNGLNNTDKKMLEMAKVFRVGAGKRIAFIHIPNLVPYFTAAASVALGMSWKAGVAAEVIAQVGNSIGNEMYYAKLYLAMNSLFAWTAVTVVLSVVFERLFLLIIRFAVKRSYK